MLNTFLDVIVPVIAIAAVGGVVGRRIGLDLDTLSKVIFYLFTPALVFTGLSSIELEGGAIARLTACSIGVFVINAAIALVWARLRGLEAAQRASVAITSAVPNQGNMGLPMASLAFGTVGLEFGTVLFAVGIVLNASAAVALGAMALGEHTPGRALLAPLRYPSIYAAAAGVIVNVLNVDLPVAIEEPIATLADASIPCMLVVLGLSFHLPKPGHLEHPIAVSINRLVLGPLAAFALVSLVGLHGTAHDVTILMAGMPAAVNTTILAGRLGADVPLAVRIVVVSTSLSIVTLTVLLTIL